MRGEMAQKIGVAFGVGGLKGKFHAKDLGGYAIFGAVYFLIAALLLSRTLSRLIATETVGWDIPAG